MDTNRLLTGPVDIAMHLLPLSRLTQSPPFFNYEPRKPGVFWLEDTDSASGKTGTNRADLLSVVLFASIRVHWWFNLVGFFRG